MSYNSANLSFGNFGQPNNSTNNPMNWAHAQFVWTYTTTDNLATVFPGTHDYFGSETRVRIGDLVYVTASDGNAHGFIQNDTYNGITTDVRKYTT